MWRFLGATAAIGVSTVGEIGVGETVFVAPVAGGVGAYAVQLAKLAGNHVIGTCSTDEKAEWIRRLGCDRPINYRREDLDKVLTDEYPNGINLFFDGIGGQMFDLGLKHLAQRGRLVNFGFVSEYGRGFAWDTVVGPRIYLPLMGMSGSVRSYDIHHFEKEWHEHIASLIALINEGRIQAPVDPTEFRGIESIKDAVAYVANGQNRGKVVIRF